MTRGLPPSSATATLLLQFVDFRIEVRTNNLQAAARLQRYFGAYPGTPGLPVDARIDVIDGEPEYDEGRLREWGRSDRNRAPKETYYDAGGCRYILKNRTGMLIKLRGRNALIIGDVERNLNQVVNLIGTLFGLSLVEKGYAMLHASAVVRTGDGRGGRSFSATRAPASRRSRCSSSNRAATST